MVSAIRKEIIACLFVVSIGIFALPASTRAGVEITCDSITGTETSDILELKKAKCDEEIKQHEAMVKQKTQEATSLKRDLDIIANNVAKTKAEIKSRDIKITSLGKEIDKKSATIDTLDGKMGKMRDSAAELIRRSNELESSSLVEVILDSKNLSEFYADIGSFDSIQEQLDKTFVQMKEVKGLTEKEKADLKVKTEKERYAKNLQDIEKKKLEVQQGEQKRILDVTKGEEQKYRVLLIEKQQIAEKIRNTILKITGGGELKFFEALKYTRVAEQAIGIRSAFILAILTQETGIDGVIGANLGKCFYNTSRNNPSGTVMKDDQKPAFLALLQQIGKDPNTTPVSCPIKRDGQYGGALGPSQFMPNTWMLYKSRVESITKAPPASPFNNLDAFTGTALYLSDAMVGCENIYRTQYSRESCAAAKYYAGGKWRNYMNGYGARVANRAVEFQKDIDILDAQ